LHLFGTSGTFLLPTEVWNIDKKIDDGLPGSGKVLTWEISGVNCNNVAASNAVALSQTATYNLTYTSKSCSIIFKNMW
jgi:hypothetical protein